MTTLATLANMRQHYTGIDVFAYSPNTGEECSANPADYFTLGPDDTLKDDEDQPMILVRSRHDFVDVVADAEVAEQETPASTRYAVNVQTETRNGKWTGAISSPTFYLDANVQGIVSEDHAKRIVEHWLTDAGLTVISVTAVVVD